jgi:hypothetical protein
MEGRGGSSSRRGSSGLDIADALAIIFVIVLLTSTLGALLASRNPSFMVRTKEWIRVVTRQINASLLAPNQAAAEAPPSTDQPLGY